MREEVLKVLKFESQVKKELIKIDKIRNKTKNVQLFSKEKEELETLLMKTKDVSILDAKQFANIKKEYYQIRTALRNASKKNKEKIKVEKALYKDLNQIAKKEKRQAMNIINQKLENAKKNLVNNNNNNSDDEKKYDAKEMKIEFKMSDIKDNDDDEYSLNSENLEIILNRISSQASFKSEMFKNDVIEDIGSRKLNNKFCLPIVNSFTNAKDLIQYLDSNHRSSTYCFELVRIIGSNKYEQDKCNLLLKNSNEWIAKGEIFVNNKLRSKLRELFLSDKFKNEQCPLAIRKFYADTYFGGKYSLYGKNICQIKSICYRSIVESFRDEAIDKISEKDKEFLVKQFHHYTVFDPFAGTGNWALQMCKLIKSPNAFLWELEKNIFQTIIENNKENKDYNLHAFNHSFEIIPESVINHVNKDENNNNGLLILLSPPWGKSFKPGIGIDLTKGLFPIDTLLKFYNDKLPNKNISKSFVIQVDKNISNFGNILNFYDIILRNDHLLIIKEKKRFSKS